MGSHQRFREEEGLQSVGQQDQMTGRDVSLKSGKDPTLVLGVKVVLSPAFSHERAHSDFASLRYHLASALVSKIFAGNR